LGVEDTIDLLSRQALGDEDVDQSSETDISAGAIDDCDNLNARGTNAPHQTGALLAVCTSHSSRTGAVQAAHRTPNRAQNP
jgi:hypothetical protein